LTSIENELEILRKIDHPNLLRVHELYRDDKNFHFVTEYLPGGELFSLIDKKGPLKEFEASGIFLQLVLALQHMHALEICHRDLKPENIMFTSKSGFNIKVIDFGLSKLNT
jgi:serine/threonine protein kinase